MNNPMDVYQTYCFACHDTGAASAPVLSNRDFWQAVSNDRERLYRVTIKGFKAMPPKGTCFDCTDQQLTQVVDWIIDQP
ncbi:MAG: c-type cytochrome [Pseudomonadales bacterium]|nr:c-type cytochrome [Pseudomonadales bacterium]